MSDKEQGAEQSWQPNRRQWEPQGETVCACRTFQFNDAHPFYNAHYQDGFLHSVEYCPPKPIRADLAQPVVDPQREQRIAEIRRWSRIQAEMEATAERNHISPGESKNERRLREWIDYLLSCIQPAGELTVEQTWLPYEHDTCPRECWLWLSFPSGVSLHWLKKEPFFWFENDPTHYMIANIPTPPQVEQTVEKGS